MKADDRYPTTGGQAFWEPVHCYLEPFEFFVDGDPQCLKNSRCRPLPCLSLKTAGNRLADCLEHVKTSRELEDCDLRNAVVWRVIAP